MNTDKQDSPEILCSRCGTPAVWRFLDETREMLEIDCPDCGRFEISKAELEQAEFDIVPAEERRE
jgi:DNA-directed RNA polymerase subunit RPC12/RpoP